MSQPGQPPAELEHLTVFCLTCGVIVFDGYARNGAIESADPPLKWAECTERQHGLRISNEAVA